MFTLGLQSGNPILDITAGHTTALFVKDPEGDDFPTGLQGVKTILISEAKYSSLWTVDLNNLVIVAITSIGGTQSCPGEHLLARHRTYDSPNFDYSVRGVA